jgi:hypothetical protein
MSQTKFKVEDGLLVRGQANITGNTVISGTLSLEANVLTSVAIGGDVTPTTNNSFTLGNTSFDWSYVYADRGVFRNTIEVTNTANLYGGVYTQGDVTFNQNNHAVGNTSAMPIVYSTNTFVYDTLRVGNSSVTYLLANSSAINLNSNLALTGAKLSLKNAAVSLLASNTTNKVISLDSGAPTTIDESLKDEGFRLIKYHVVAKDNTTVANKGMQSSEITLMYDSVTDTIYISEYNIMHTATAPFMNFNASVTSTQLRLVASSATASNVDVSYVRTAVV